MKIDLSLEPVCTISNALELKKTLLDLLEKGQEDVVLDGGAVRRMDTASFQVLVAFVRSMELRGRQVEWSKVSPTLADGARLLGLDGPLGLGKDGNL